MNSSLWDLPDDIIETVFIDLFRKRQLDDMLNLALSGKFLYERYLNICQNQCQDLYKIHKFIWKSNNNSITSYRNAIIKNRLDVIKWIYESEFPLRGVTSDENALVLAAEYGNLDLLIWFYNHGGDADDNKQYNVNLAMKSAARENHIHILKWLDKNASPSRINIIDFAVNKGDINTIKWLYERGYTGTVYAIMEAAKFGYLDIIKWIHKTIKIQWSNNTIDYAFITGNHLNCAKYLHKKGYGCTTSAMDWAADGGYLESIKWLHENRQEGCSTHAVNTTAANGHFDCLKWLYENKKKELYQY